MGQFRIAGKQQGLVPDPNFPWIWDSCIGFILGNVNSTYHARYTPI